MKKIAIILTLIIILSVSVSAVWWNPATWFENSQEPPVKVFAPNELAYLEIKESACGKTELSPEDVVLASYLPGGPDKAAGFEFPNKPPKAVEEVEQFLASCAQLGPNPKDQDVILAVEAFAPKEGKEINRPEVKQDLVARWDPETYWPQQPHPDSIKNKCKEVANDPTLANAKDIQDWLDQQSSDAIIVKSQQDKVISDRHFLSISHGLSLHRRDSAWKLWNAPEDDDLEPQEHAERRSSIAAKGNIWPPYNDPDSNWPWNKFIPQSQNPCKEISSEKVIVTSDNVKIGDKEYTPEQVELTILRPGFLAAKVELPGKPGGPATYPEKPSWKARNDRPIYRPPREIIKSTPDTESNGNEWVEGELAQGPWYGSDIPQEVIDEYGLASRWGYGPDADSAIQPKAKQDTNLDESVLAGYLPGGPDKAAGFEFPNKPPKAQEDQSEQQVASVIPGRETVQPPLAARHGREGWFFDEDDFLAIIIPGGPHTDKPQKLCTKNVELNIKPGVPPSIPPYPGSPPISPRSQKYEEINPQDFIKLQISRNACDKGKTIAEGIISIPKEEVKLAMINVPGMPRPITKEPIHIGAGSAEIVFPTTPKATDDKPEQLKTTIHFTQNSVRIIYPEKPPRKDMSVPPRGSIRDVAPAQLPPAPKLPEMPKTEFDDKDCCIKCQPVFQTRIVSINDQCPEGFYKRIFEGCDKHEVKYLQSFCPKKEQTKQISTKNPVPTMPPTVPERPKLS